MDVPLDNRGKVAHLLRRFGLGASHWELDEYEKLGPQKTMERLLDFGPEFPSRLHTLQWAFKSEAGEDAEPGSYRFVGQWLYDLITTDKPLRERVAVFWHDHFAIDDNKVEDGLASMHYMETVRRVGGGKFRDILGAMVREPAFMKMLDVRMMSKGEPNENFARELMELYTLGVGHYTEDDVKEVSRAMTGWTYFNTYYETNAKNAEKLRKMHEFDQPYTMFAWVPDAHDPRSKTVLGKKVDDAEQVLDLLASHPRTAEFVCHKMWRFFGGDYDSPSAVAKLARVFTKTKGDTKAVLMELSRIPEFWDEKCVRRKVKDPLQFCVGYVRAMGAKDGFDKVVPKEMKFDEPVPKHAFDMALGVHYWMGQQGMVLLYCPSVAGWEKGDAWITSNNLLRRRQFNGIFTFYEESKGKWKPDVCMLNLTSYLTARKPQVPRDLVNGLCDFFDCPLPEESRATATAFVIKHGGLDIMKDATAYAWIMHETMGVMRMAPEFHLC
ncbi:MAG: DUF1800 domain-containing protein [Fimbriimonadaceae bacterium]|nr:DUF1800 domain-containing protein [Fimbriimonadaceae bacterium]